jgi:SET domain-containing protein
MKLSARAERAAGTTLASVFASCACVGNLRYTAPRNALFLAAMKPEKSAKLVKVKRSGIHGRGVYARRKIKAGQRIIEYAGERIDWPEALRRHPHDPQQPNHTFYFTVDDETVIDGNANGNNARWINHGCAPNCEAELLEEDGAQRVFIIALRDIAEGEELTYDYGLEIDARYTKKLKKEFECRCGSEDCRGTMLAPKSK